MRNLSSEDARPELGMNGVVERGYGRGFMPLYTRRGRCWTKQDKAILPRGIVMHVYKSWPSHFDVAESLVTNHTTNLEPLNDTITEHTVASQKGDVGVAESLLRGRRRNKPRKGLGSQDSITRSPENDALMMAHLLIWRQGKCLRGDNARWVTTTLRSGNKGGMAT